MATLGQKIRELREAKDVSLRELAKRVELSAAFLSDIELGRRFPSGEVLAKIATALGISTEELKTFDQRPPIEELKRLSETNPRYGFAFRKLVDSNFSPEELIKLAEDQAKKSK